MGGRRPSRGQVLTAVLELAAAGVGVAGTCGCDRSSPPVAPNNAVDAAVPSPNAQFGFLPPVDGAARYLRDEAGSSSSSSGPSGSRASEVDARADAVAVVNADSRRAAIERGVRERASDAGVPGPADARPSTYRLVVSFLSFGTGIDNQAQTHFLAILQDFHNDHGVTLQVRQVHWGMEGETSYCLPLEPLGPSEQQRFIARLRRELPGRRIRIAEHAPCQPQP